MTLEAEPTPQPRRGRGRPPRAPEPEPNAAVDAQLESLGMVATEAAPPDDLMAPPDNAEPPQPQQPPEAEAQAAEDTFSPFRRDPLPPPRETRVQQKAERTETRQAKPLMTPSKKRFGILGEKIPGAEHIKVHKRLDNGELAYVGEYDANALSQSQDVEGFLNRYIKGSYGPGEYQITGVDATGRNFDGGKVILVNPLSSPDLPPSTVSPSNPLALVQQMLEQDARRRDAEIRSMMGQQKDPIQMLKDIHELQQSMAPPMPQLKPSEGGNKGNDTMAVMMAGMFNMMGTVLSVAMQPKQPDPLMVALIQSLTQRPTTPAVDPTQQLVALSEVAKNLGGGGGGAGTGQLVDLLLKERMTPQDVLGLINSVKSERGTDGLKKSMEDIGIMLSAVNQLRAHTEPSTSSGFWDAVTAILGNRELAGAIGARVRSTTPQQVQTQGRPQALPPPQQQQQPRALLPQGDPLTMKARELAARKMRLEEAEILKREQALGLKPLTTPAPQAPPPAAAGPTDPQVGTQRVQPISDEAAQNNTLPPNIAEYINRYLEAKDDGAIVENTIELIRNSLAADEKWRPYAEMILSYVLQSDRAKFLQYMASFFVSLRTIGLIEDTMARKIMDCLHRNFETIVTMMQQQAETAAEGEGDDEGEGEEGEEGSEEGEEEGEEDGDGSENPLGLDT